MRWFRTNKIFGGRLALFALAVQFILSFGHVHVHGIGRSAPVFVAGVHGSAGAPTPTPTPTQDKPDSDDYCAICATVSLLSGSVAAMPPQLALPVVSQVVEHADSVAIAVIVPRRAPFQSRAPPQA
jgi:hypothetical protein